VADLAQLRSEARAARRRAEAAARSMREAKRRLAERAGRFDERAARGAAGRREFAGKTTATVDDAAGADR